MTDLLERLRVAAEAATPGPYTIDWSERPFAMIQIRTEQHPDDVIGCVDACSDDPADHALAELWRQLDPATALALVRVAEAARAIHDQTDAFASALERNEKGSDLSHLHNDLGEALKALDP